MRSSGVLPALVLSLLVPFVGCGPGGGPAATPGPTTGWQLMPPGPLGGRVGVTVVGLDADHALVVGGWEWLCPPTADCALPESPMRSDGAVVDLRTGEWRSVAPAPYGFVQAPSAVLHDDVYVLTGSLTRRRPQLIRYRVDDDAWQVLGDVPGRERGPISVVAYDDRLLVASDTRLRLYDPVGDAWSALPDAPLPAAHDRFAVTVGDRLLVLGSAADPAVGKVGASYDPVTTAWTRLPDAPSRGYQAWGVGGRVWLNGHFGTDGGAVLDPASGTWGSLPADRPADSGDLAGVVGDGEAAYEYEHGWVLDARTGTWLEMTDPHPTTYDETVAAVGSALVVAGGQDWGEPPGGATGRLVSDVWVWRPPAR